MYLLEVCGIFTLLFIVYHLALSNLTFHTLNRVLLLGIMVLSLVLPLVHFETIHTIPLQLEDLPLQLEEWDFQSIDTPLSLVESGFSWSIIKVLKILYFSGLGYFVLRLLLSIIKLKQEASNSAIAVDGKYRIVSTSLPSIFSCFNWIFIPKAMTASCNAKIVEHEKLHGSKGHSYDLVVTELFSALLWFNPFVYLFRKSIKSVHEYQVDAELLQTDIKKSEYLSLILNNLNTKTPTVGLYNYFNGITLKKRIEMITKHKSSKRQLVRYLLLVPIVALFSMSFTVITESVEHFDSEDEVAVSVNNVPSISPIEESEIIRIATGWGMRMHPITKEKKFHSGFDFVADKGTPIAATADGQIAVAELKGDYGNFVVIHHGIYETGYAHMDNFIVTEGQNVKQGDIIGYVGNTGKSTGNHLHYEVRKGNEKLDPSLFITK